MTPVRLPSSRNGSMAGWLFLVTHVTSVGAALLYGGTYLYSAEPADRSATLTAVGLEIILAAAVLGTSVALYPTIRTAHPGPAEAYVALRTLEASVILAGVLAIAPTVAAPGSDVATALDSSAVDTLRLVHDWAFLIGPGIVCPISTVVLALLFARRRLVPRPIAILGLIGGPLIGMTNIAVMFGIIASSPAIAVVPIFTWEVSLAVYLIVRGVRVSPSGSPESPRTTVGASGHRPDADLRVEDRGPVR